MIDVVLGETLWAAVRRSAYAAAFLATMAALGATTSLWALAALPASFAVAYAFGALATAGTAYMRSWSDTQLVQLLTVPMLLFATTFYPLSVYPTAIRPVIQVLPLYQANCLMRSITAGVWSLASTLSVAYLILLAVAGTVVSMRRLDRILFA